MALPLSLEFRSVQVSHWLTLLHRVESSIFVCDERPKRLSSTSLDSNRVSSLATTRQWALEAKRGLGKVEMPSRVGGVNGTVKFSVVDSPGVPPLTPVSLLIHVGAVIDLISNRMDLKRIETTTTLRALPSGHVAHKLTEFAPGGWKAPTPEQTELFQLSLVRSNRGQANSALDSQVVSCTQSAIGHISLRLIISMILTCVLTIPCLLTSSPMINWLKERLFF